MSLSAHRVLSMKQRTILHIVDGSTSSRAEQARMGHELGYHCEIYADVGELMSFLPRKGVVLARDDYPANGVAQVLRAVTLTEHWMPVIGTSADPDPCEVVAAIKAGAMHYLRLPLEKERLRDAVDQISSEAHAYADARRKMIEARNRIASLSPREREVLDWLSEGRSNKMIALELNISPRTVEIHRANMMSKLGAQHAAEAVRLRLEADLEKNTVMAGVA